MSDNWNWEDEYAEDYLEEQEDCDFGFEFCIDPITKALGLCTTECATYLNSLEEEDTKPLGPFAGCPRCGVLNGMTAKQCWYCGEKLQ